MRVLKPIVMLLLFIFSASVSFAIDEIIPGEIQHHEPEGEVIWDYVTYVPEDYNKDYVGSILLTVEGGSSYEENINNVSGMIDYTLEYSNPLRLIRLGIAIPRVDAYTVAFGDDSFDDNLEDYLTRADEKTNAIIDQFIGKLEEDGHTIDHKVLIYGASNGGMFAQRYTLLQPDRVKAIVGGQCGGVLTLPLSEYTGFIMNWVIGINDLEELTGITFDFESYKQVSQFFYIGEKDDTHSTIGPNTSFRWTDEEIEFLNATFGDTDPIRVQNQSQLLKDLGCNVTFKMYPDLGHQDSPEIYQDTYNFFSNFIVKQDGGSGGSGGGGSGGICFINATKP